MNRRKTNIAGPAATVLALALTNGAAFARDASDPYEPFRAPFETESDHRFDDSQIKPWKEEVTDIPALSEAGLRPVDIDHGPPGLSFMVDMDTLAVDAEDNVVRYWVVTESGGRKTNVLYEGIHCAQGEYKTYAHASPRRLSLIKPVKSPEWQAIGPPGGTDYHSELMHAFFCWKGSPRSIIGMNNAVYGSHKTDSPHAEDADFIKP